MRDHSIRLKIGQMRKAAGMSQGELAARVGINQSVLSGYEHGTHLPSLDTTVKIADVLGCTLDEMIWRPDMTRVRLSRIRETERRNDKRIEEWKKAHEQD